MAQLNIALDQAEILQLLLENLPVESSQSKSGQASFRTPDRFSDMGAAFPSNKVSFREFRMNRQAPSQRVGNTL